MTAVNINTMRLVEGGRTYYCPWCSYSGGYWSVYWHALYNGCFKKNRYLKGLWDSGWSLIKIGAKLAGYL